ncbi:Rv3235 family protein [Tsukamurella sp. 8F]|uniref:Rv3235 family protein n=1 Tax=unclassified Tsukamurella TaxID=2633480 RepID=UPI0023B9FFCE|nr:MULTISPECIES: Rv3235 family protein [unclassified Tsukamurella]MDF0529049.1 Rv3235 family protein [Tsukamurella sp. 8J]MDF0587422.1 Rv3235 family protein [Tsukamurella sp. 8F]
MGALSIEQKNQFTVLRAPAIEPPITEDEPPDGTADGEVFAAPGDESCVRQQLDGAAPMIDAASALGEAELATARPEARVFVLATLRPVFEVLDRRRPARHLSPIASATVVDVLRTLADGPAQPTVSGHSRVHVAAPRPVGGRRQRRPTVGAEVFLTYTRGPRVLAAAGRVERADGHWRWTAFTTVA